MSDEELTEVPNDRLPLIIDDKTSNLRIKRCKKTNYQLNELMTDYQQQLMYEEAFFRLDSSRLRAIFTRHTLTTILINAEEYY